MPCHHWLPFPSCFLRPRLPHPPLPILPWTPRIWDSWRHEPLFAFSSCHLAMNHSAASIVRPVRTCCEIENLFHDWRRPDSTCPLYLPHGSTARFQLQTAIGCFSWSLRLVEKHRRRQSGINAFHVVTLKNVSAWSKSKANGTEYLGLFVQGFMWPRTSYLGRWYVCVTALIWSMETPQSKHVRYGVVSKASLCWERALKQAARHYLFSNANYSECLSAQSGLSSRSAGAVVLAFTKNRPVEGPARTQFSSRSSRMIFRGFEVSRILVGY